MGTSTDKNPTYTYTTPGVYDVTLTVFGLGGTTSYTRTGYITVTTPSFDVSLGSINPSGSATLTGLGEYVYNTVCQLEATNAGGQSYADVVFMIAQPLSMSSIAANVPGLVTALEAALVAGGIGAGVDPNNYALVGFEDGSTTPADTPTKKSVGGGDWGTAAQLNTAIGALAFPFTAADQSGDGYYACEFALANYTFRNGAPKLFVIVSNEERRDITSGATTEATTLAALTAANVILNVCLQINVSYTPVAFLDGYGREGSTSTVWVSDAVAPYYGTRTFQAWQNPTGTRNLDAITTYVALCESANGDSWCFVDFSTATGFINAFSDANTAAVVVQASASYAFDHFVLNGGSNITTNPYSFNVVSDTTVDVYMV